MIALNHELMISSQNDVALFLKMTHFMCRCFLYKKKKADEYTLSNKEPLSGDFDTKFNTVLNIIN